MVSRAVKLAICLFSITSARAELNLAPEVAEYELDGVKMHRLVFADGPERITYSPPNGWEYSRRDSQTLVLRPHGMRGEATITRLAVARRESFDDETIKHLTEEVLAAVPSGAKNVSIVSQQKNPLIIERKETFLVIIKYEFYGEPHLRSIMFLYRKNEQLRFQLTAPQSEFQRLQEAFRGSQYSWQNL
jgi:hypothetical protein